VNHKVALSNHVFPVCPGFPSSEMKALRSSVKWGPWGFIRKTKSSCWSLTLLPFLQWVLGSCHPARTPTLSHTPDFVFGHKEVLAVEKRSKMQTGPRHGFWV
jgi:hypothetical protein